MLVGVTHVLLEEHDKVTEWLHYPSGYIIWLVTFRRNLKQIDYLTGCILQLVTSYGSRIV